METQTPQDRHDLLARVFYLKLKKLIDFPNKGAIFGSTHCFMFFVEWQKWGLHHSHILVWLEEKLRPTSADSFISSELPNPNADPVLHDKRYPRALLQGTQTDNDGYPLYHRSKPEDGGFTAKDTVAGCTVAIDNRWISLTAHFSQRCSMLISMLSTAIQSGQSSTSASMSREVTRQFFDLSSKVLYKMKWQGTRLADASVAMKQHGES